MADLFPGYVIDTNAISRCNAHARLPVAELNMVAPAFSSCPFRPFLVWRPYQVDGESHPRYPDVSYVMQKGVLCAWLG
jgi:hypothetical protein